MKVRFAREELCEAVQGLSAAVSQRAPQPALQCIHIEADGGTAVLSATDLQIAIRRGVVPRQVHASGVGLIHGTRLAALLRELADEEVLVEIDEASASLTGERSSFKLLSYDAAEYPRLPTLSKASIRVPSREFELAVQQTAFATAQEQGRYALNGVSLAFVSGSLELAATDGRRLAVTMVRADGKPWKERLIVPRKMLAEVQRASAGAEELEFGIEGGKLLVRAGEALVVGSLIDGAYPEYRDMIPSEGPHSLVVSSSSLASALRQALQVTTEDSRSVSLDLTAREMHIRSKSSAVGEASIRLDAAYDGEPLTISFNPQFLLDGLAHLEEEEVSIEISSTERPAVIRREGFVYVVAPVRAREPL